LALVLTAFPPRGPEAAIGIARIVRYPDRPTAADVAVTVADQWQGKGVATALLNELRRKRPVGVTQIVTEVATDNPASLAMLRRLGETTITPAGPGRFEVVVELPDAAP
jgi:RimJ/RimL family protein N-acetyltransferase